jgi:hypothetical protein
VEGSNELAHPGLTTWKPAAWEGRITDHSETVFADSETVWDQTQFVKGTGVRAVTDGERIRILSGPSTGNRSFRPGRSWALRPAKVTERHPAKLLNDAVGASSVHVKAQASPCLLTRYSEDVPARCDRVRFPTLVADHEDQD